MYPWHSGSLLSIPCARILAIGLPVRSDLARTQTSLNLPSSTLDPSFGNQAMVCSPLHIQLHMLSANVGRTFAASKWASHERERFVSCSSQRHMGVQFSPGMRATTNLRGCHPELCTSVVLAFNRYVKTSAGGAGFLE